MSNIATTPAMPITAPQGETRTPKVFQARIISNLCQLLLSPAHPPCLLRSPTGSGKTFMLTRALQQVCSQQPTLWLWFVPFVNLVAQTVDSIDSEGVGLAAVQLATALNEEPAAGLVLISTVQGVASAKDRKTGYTGNEDDDKRSLAAYVQRARAAGLAIGCVVDEAHIALKTTTEFGQFVQWLKADYLLMASATPRDDRLTQFITSAGFSHIESFSVSRADVVKERLNKAWIETVVYDLRASMQSVTDLKMAQPNH
jgi:type III restriction enzyme